MVAGGFANKSAKNTQYPGTSTPSSPFGISKDDGGGRGSVPALTTAVDGSRGGAETRKMIENGGRGGGEVGGGVPAPSNGCEEAFSKKGPLQQPEEQPRGPQTTQVENSCREGQRLCVLSRMCSGREVIWSDWEEVRWSFQCFCVACLRKPGFFQCFCGACVKKLQMVNAHRNVQASCCIVTLVDSGRAAILADSVVKCDRRAPCSLLFSSERSSRWHLTM